MANPVKNPTGGALISFKVGSQSTIDNWLKSPSTYASAISEGTFYLTEDTHRLYIGNQDHTVSALNEGIETYNNIASLPTASITTLGHFYYAKAENVLCVGAGYKNGQGQDAYQWIQINQNTDHYHKDFSRAVSNNSSNNTATITDSFNDQNNAPTTLSVILKGDNGIIITQEAGASTPTIKISGDTYTLSTANSSTTGEVDIKLDSSNSTNDSKVTIKKGANINLSVPSSGTDSGKLVLSAENDVPNSLTFNNAANSGNGFVASIGITNKSPVTGNFDPVINTGLNGNTSTHFVNGEATLPVYTIEEIDGLVEGLNAMHYIGTVNDLGTGTGAKAIVINTTPNTITIVKNNTETALKVKIGDTFLANENGMAGKKPGTLFIATGTEGSDGYITAASLKFEIVEETYFTDTNYELTWLPNSNGNTVPSIALKDAAPGGQLVGGATTFAKGTAINISASRSGNNQTITVAHGNVSHSDTNGTATSMAEAVSGTGNISASTPITVVTGVTVNTQGHVTGVEKTQYTLKDTNAILSSNAYSSNAYTSSNVKVGVLSNSVQDTNSLGGHNTATGKAVFTSETLNINAVATTDGYGSTASDTAYLNGLNIEMVWGTF